MTKMRFGCLVLCFCGLVNADYVPVLIWGSHIQYEPGLALKFYNGDDFIDVMSELSVTPETVTLVITEDQLTTEDLTQCKTENGSCFQGIQQIHDKLYLANVEDPLPTMADIAGADKIEVNFLPNGSLSKSLKDNFQSYIFINFESNADDERKSTKLTYHDQLVTKLHNELVSNDQRFLVIFTGKSSGNQKRSIREISDPQPTIDEVEGNKTKIPGIFWKRDEFLLYYTSFDIVDDSRNQSIYFDEVSVIEADDTSKVMNVSMKVTESEDYFAFSIIEKNGYWWVNEATWNDKKLFLSRHVSAAFNTSYHCTPSTELFTVNRTVAIAWNGLQLQPNFNSTEGEPLKQFSDAWDCVYFFSAGIMSGMFVVCLMLFILFIGILCIMDINTNDRFDKSQKKLFFNVDE